ncbi:MAG: hypothetical protein MJA83_01655 [Gammaproteobacteria bacterium]|nr:hypothetical protein [Gammaproteobacteria bacterium]
MSNVALLGTALLVLLSLIPATAVRQTRRFWVFTFAGALLALAAQSAFIKLQNLQPNVRAERVLKKQLGRLELAIQSGQLPEALILIEGGSSSARGLNGELLQSLLAQSGHAALVLQFSMGGANHFERHKLISRFAEEYRKLRGVGDINVILLLEVNRSYDFSPLSQFSENKFSDVNFYYSDAENLYYAAKALWNFSKETSQSSFFSRLPPILQHILIKELNIGAAHHLKHFSEIRPFDSFRPLDETVPTFRFYNFSKTKIPVPAEESEVPILFPPGWLEIREQRLFSLFEEKLGHHAFFSVPTNRAEVNTYLRIFCQIRKEEICIDGTDNRLLSELNDRKYFYDAGHLTRLGSEIYTRWFYSKLINSAIFQ